MAKKTTENVRTREAGSTAYHEADFEKIVGLIEVARLRVAQAVNTAIIDLYWKVGEYLLRKIQSDGWGNGKVQKLSAFIQRR